MPVFNNALAGAAGSGGAAADYKIERSLRFNSGDSAYLSRTPSSAGNRKTWTWSGWVKRSNLGTEDGIFVCSNSTETEYVTLYFNSANELATTATAGVSTDWSLKTNRVFRDVSAWIHIVLVVDTTQATNSNRVKLYVNGVQETSFRQETYPSQNFQGRLNNTVPHAIGSAYPYNTWYSDFYLADVHFIDGQALAPTDFGEFDADTGVWNPIEFTGNHNPITGVDYSSMTVASNGGWHADPYGVDSGFNGIVGSGSGGYAQAANGTANPNSITFTPTGGISYSTSVEVWLINNANTVSVNGGTAQSIAGLQWVTVATGPGTLTSLKFERPSTNGASFGGIRVDGVDLVNVQGSYNGFHLDFSDNSSNAALGTDSSGNSNTWTVNNLIAERTANGTYGATISNSTLNYDPSVIFDGVITSSYQDRPTNNTTVTFTGIPTASTSLRIGVHYIESGTMTTNGSLTVVNATSAIYSAAWYEPQNITYPFTLTSLTVNGGSASHGFGIGAIEVDGVVLDNGSGVNTDQLLDSPTNYEADSGNNGGNYCTINPLSQSSGTFTQGNLRYFGPGSWAHAFGTMAFTSGKWYYEVTLATGPYGQSSANDHNGFGWGEYKTNETSSPPNITTAVFLQETGWYKNFTGSKTNASQVFAPGDVLSVAVDLDANTFEFKRNGASVVSGTIGGTPGRELAPFFVSYDNQYGLLDVNFGQRPFAYTPPTGYKSLCTQNLDDPLIADGSDYFDVKTWSGTGAENTLTGFEFSPDMIWVKRRNNSTDWHNITDTVRGATNTLYPNDQYSDTVASQNVKAFTSDGVTLGTFSGVNASGGTYVGWAWDAGSSNTPISVGSLNSSLYTQDAVYSGGTVTGATYSGYGWANAFDADFSNAAAGNGPTNTTTIDLSSFSITANAGEIVLVFNSNVSSNTYWRFNGVTPTTSNTSMRQTDNGYEFTLTSATSLTGITLDGASQLTGVFVAGKRLIDSNVSITTPSVASTVRANPSAGFSIVSYTGTGANASIAHNLNAVPEFAIFKARNGDNHWLVYHKSIGNDKKVNLNLADAQSSSSTSYFQSTDPTSNVFYLGTESSGNWSGYNMIGYLFSSVEGYSAFGSYTGNGSADGPFVYTGFRPAIIIQKRTDSSGSWTIVDTARDIDNPAALELLPNSTAAEYNNTSLFDILSNGFKVRATFSNLNASGGSFLYIAFAENPFKTARAR